LKWSLNLKNDEIEPNWDLISTKIVTNGKEYLIAAKYKCCEELNDENDHIYIHLNNKSN